MLGPTWALEAGADELRRPARPAAAPARPGRAGRRQWPHGPASSAADDRPPSAAGGGGRAGRDRRPDRAGGHRRRDADDRIVPATVPRRRRHAPRRRRRPAPASTAPLPAIDRAGHRRVRTARGGDRHRRRRRAPRGRHRDGAVRRRRPRDAAGGGRADDRRPRRADARRPHVRQHLLRTGAGRATSRSGPTGSRSPSPSSTATARALSPTAPASPRSARAIILVADHRRQRARWQPRSRRVRYRCGSRWASLWLDDSTLAVIELRQHRQRPSRCACSCSPADLAGYEPTQGVVIASGSTASVPRTRPASPTTARSSCSRTAGSDQGLPTPLAAYDPVDAGAATRARTSCCPDRPSTPGTTACLTWVGADDVAPRRRRRGPRRVRLGPPGRLKPELSCRTRIGRSRTCRTRHGSAERPTEVGGRDQVDRRWPPGTSCADHPRLLGDRGLHGGQRRPARTRRPCRCPC